MPHHILADSGGAIADLSSALAKLWVVDHFFHITQAIRPIPEIAAGERAAGTDLAVVISTAIVPIRITSKLLIVSISIAAGAVSALPTILPTARLRLAWLLTLGLTLTLGLAALRILTVLSFLIVWLAVLPLTAARATQTLATTLPSAGLLAISLLIGWLILPILLGLTIAAALSTRAASTLTPAAACLLIARLGFLVSLAGLTLLALLAAPG